MSPLLFPSLGTSQLQAGCLGNDRVLLQAASCEVTHSCQQKTLQMFFNLSTEQTFLCHPSRETIFVIAYLSNFVLFQNMLRQNFMCHGELHQADKPADWDTTGHRFIPEEKVEQDKILMAAQRYPRLQGTRTSCRVKPVTINSWVGNSQQTTALIKCTLFPATEKLLKLLEVPCLLLVITNWALYGEDQWKICASVKCPEALETEDVTAFEVFQRLLRTLSVHEFHLLLKSCLLQSRE